MFLKKLLATITCAAGGKNRVRPAAARRPRPVRLVMEALEARQLMSASPLTAVPLHAPALAAPTAHPEQPAVISHLREILSRHYGPVVGNPVYLQPAVTGAAATHFGVVATPGDATAGQVVRVTVTALDLFNKPVTNYTGKVYFSSSDGEALLPKAYTFTAGDHGRHTFEVTLKTAGEQSIIVQTEPGYLHPVRDHVLYGRADVMVHAGSATHFRVVAPLFSTSGQTVRVTVVALDRFNNLVTNYAGKVYFSSSDRRAVLPAAYTFTAGDHGRHTFAVTLKTAGKQSIIVETEPGVVHPVRDRVLYGLAKVMVESRTPLRT